MNRLYQCVSMTCRKDMDDDSKVGCMIIVFGDNIATAKMCPLFKGKIPQEFKELF